MAAPIYPPEIGGPAHYAYHLVEEFRRLGHQVRVVKFTEVRHWPAGLRHLVYFFKLLPVMLWADWAVAFDTLSVGLPAVLAARLCRTKIVIRVGGDFLWESYVERTGLEIALPDFYLKLPQLNLWEHLIFSLTRYLCRHSQRLVFTTEWQRDLWCTPYRLLLAKTSISENFYGSKLPASNPVHKNFICAGRVIKLKNLTRLQRIFAQLANSHPDLVLDVRHESQAELLAAIKRCYAVIVASFSEVSPNIILEAVRYNKPFIVTRYCGFLDRLSGLGLQLDPFDDTDITQKILQLAQATEYQQQLKLLNAFSWLHSWQDIANEYQKIFVDL